MFRLAKSLPKIGWVVRQIARQSDRQHSTSNFALISTLVGFGASSMYGVWAIINSSIIGQSDQSTRKKLNAQNIQIFTIIKEVYYIKGYLKISETNEKNPIEKNKEK
ncbi:hypothetical protein C1645_824784 [Glomus cerebriforme]|uniref:Uncharacterized protein n=1 Tax=Glomus cerebriforme TaxID=658196 RepID=A0A397SXV0_9GLOM|nr:hypothetical protein C1645_824784 [Glomus cerebriforme]